MVKTMSLKAVARLKLMLVVLAAVMGLPVLGIAQLAADSLKPYRSEAGGFEVTYPTNWTASAENKGHSLVVFFTSPMVRDDDVFQAARIMVCSTAIGDTAWNDCTERDSHLSELYKDSVRSRKEFVVSTLKIERVATASKYNNAFFYYARFSSYGRKFFLRGDFTRSFNLDRYAPVFDKMLESFRLLSAAKPTTHSTRARDSFSFNTPLRFDRLLYAPAGLTTVGRLTNRK
jgi:hypothetical protein